MDYDCDYCKNCRINEDGENECIGGHSNFDETTCPYLEFDNDIKEKENNLE